MLLFIPLLLQKTLLQIQSVFIKENIISNKKNVLNKKTIVYKFDLLKKKQNQAMIFEILFNLNSLHRSS